jgi:predicted amidohydrolase YtcJ
MGTGSLGESVAGALLLRHKSDEMKKIALLTVAIFLLSGMTLLGCNGGGDGNGSNGAGGSEFFSPDIIFFNGQIITMEPDLPQVQALAVLGENILAVGSNEEILALQGLDTKIIDLSGRTMLPGFVDPHTHNLIYRDFTVEEQQQITLAGGRTTIAIAAVGPGELLYLTRQLQYTDLRIRTSLYLLYNNKCPPDFDPTWLLDYPPVLDPTEMLRFLGIKIIGDKGVASCGLPAMSVELPSYLVEKYGGEPYGDLIFDVEELTQIIVEHQALGYQVIIHATGDRTVETVLDAIEAALDGQPNTFRHRIEHNDFIRLELLNRYGEIGVIPTLRGRAAISQINSKGDHIFGGSVNPWYYLHRSLIDANPDLLVTWESDDDLYRGPVIHLYHLVTRKGIYGDGVSVWGPPDWYAAEAITVEEALHMMTINGAYALFMEDKVGSLKPGKFADLIILSDNPLTVDPDSLIDLEVLMTMVGGHVEYCQEGYEALCP